MLSHSHPTPRPLTTLTYDVSQTVHIQGDLWVLLGDPAMSSVIQYLSGMYCTLIA